RCRRLQEFLVEQANKGVLVCLCSRNNEEDVVAVFERHPGMVLSLNDVVGRAIGWDPKPEQMVRLAEELQLDIGSFVFLDDDPVECAGMRAACPQVLTLQMPASDEEVSGLLARLWAFDGIGGTKEDLGRKRSYQTEQTRRQVRAQAHSLADVIKSLMLRVEVRQADPNDVDRVVQITERTTQFNASS